MSSLRFKDESEYLAWQASLPSRQLKTEQPLPTQEKGKKKASRRPKLKSAPVTAAEGFLLSVSFLLPIQTVSESNQSEHWTERHRRNVAQQAAVNWEWQRMLGKLKVKLPVLVRFTRIGVQKIDQGNIEGCFKHVQDAIAALLGVDDGDEEWIRFEYRQEPGAKEYAVRVEIQHEAKGEN